MLNERTAKPKESERVQWSRWKPLSMPLMAGALAACSGNPPDGCFLVESDAGPQGCYCTKDGIATEGTLTSDQSCIPAQPAPACSTSCVGATVSGLLNPDSTSDSALTSGGITVRLDLTGQSGGSQVAFIDVLECGQLIGGSSIPSGGMKAFSSGGTSVTVNVGAVSTGTPRSAQVQAVIACGE